MSEDRFDKCLECGEPIICDIYCDDCITKFEEEDPTLREGYFRWVSEILAGVAEK